MTGDEATHVFFFLNVLNCLEVHHLQIAPLGEISLIVDDVCDAAAHSRCEIASGPAEDGYPAPCHVFAAVIADTFDDGDRAAVADGETLTCDSADESLTGGR